MSPASTSPGASYTDERRRNPRLRVSSIIYAQLGSDNGGIVANLGMDGVACHAAQKLNAEMNSAVNLRLRGSGLNADLVGEFVWLGTTQKEVGISFKSLSAIAQKDIADWIAREAEQAGASEPKGNSGPKAMSAMPGIAAKEEKTYSHSFSAALAMAGEKAADPIPSVEAGTNGLNSQAPSDSMAEISAATQTVAVPPVQPGDVPSDELGRDAQAQEDIPQLIVPGEPSHLEQSSLNELVSSLSTPERTKQIEQYDSTSIAPPDEPKTPAGQEKAEVSAQPVREGTFSTAEKIEPDAKEQVSRPPANLQESNTAEKWIPPALLAAWRRGNPRQRLIIAGAGAISLGAFGLIIALAAIHLGSSLRHSSGTVTVQQSAQQPAAPPADSPVSAASPLPVPVQAILAPDATPPPRSHRPQPSPLATLAKKLFWREPDPVPTIDDDQLRVQVWTSRNSGYYYCTDDPYAKSAQPGTFMSQGDALQSGYRPILGQFCD